MALINKRIINMKRDYVAMLLEILVPMLLIVFVTYLMTITNLKDPKTVDITPDLYSDYLPLSTLLYNDKDGLGKKFNKDNFKFEDGTSSLKSFDETNFKKISDDRLGAYFIENDKKNKYLLEIQSKAKHAGALFIN